MYPPKSFLLLFLGCSLVLSQWSCGRLSFDPYYECTYPPPGACEPTDLGSAVGMAVATGTTSGLSLEQPSCESGEAPEVAYMWTAPATGVYTFDTRGSSFDTVLHARLGSCAGPEMACNDDIDDDDANSSFEVSVAIGDRIVFFVDGFEGGQEGDFTLNIVGSEQGYCGDGRDNDGDGTIDCGDADCDGSLACREDSFCSDGADNDRDELIDCADSDCSCDRACTDICEAIPLDGLGAPIAMVNHEGACGGLLSPSCMGKSTTMKTFVWTAPSRGRYRIDTLGGEVETSLSAHIGGCAGPELGCYSEWNETGAAFLILDLTGGEQVYIVVGSRDGSVGDVPLNIGLTEKGYCLDGLDNDMDGQTDCVDPDCLNSVACTETGLCTDMADNDMDGQTDCDDSDCAGDVACAGIGVVGCPSFDLGTAVGASVGVGATIGVGAQVDASCVDASGPELSFKWTAAVTGMYRFSLEESDYDTVIHVRHGDCNGPEIACADNSGDQVYVPVQAGQTVIIFADSHEDGAGQVAVSIERSEYGSCFDTIDNDGDGDTDCSDHECFSAPICGEVARCDDGVDNDDDGDVDCDDSECECDPACSQPQCPGTDLGSALGQSVATGTTDDGVVCGHFEASCKDSHAPEHTFLWKAPVTANYRFDTAGSEFDTVLYILPPTCKGLDLGCKRSEDDVPAFVEMHVEQDQQLIIVVDGQYDKKGSYVLNISGTETGYCGNGRDDDNDGDIDCADSECADSLFCCDGVACVCGLDVEQAPPLNASVMLTSRGG